MSRRRQNSSSTSWLGAIHERGPPHLSAPSSPPYPGHHLQLFNGLLQAEQLLLDFLGLCGAQGAAPWDPIPLEGRPCPAVFLRGEQEPLEGQN